MSVESLREAKVLNGPRGQCNEWLGPMGGTLNVASSVESYLLLLLLLLLSPLLLLLFLSIPEKRCRSQQEQVAF